jgi:hypothetical protein
MFNLRISGLNTVPMEVQKVGDIPYADFMQRFYQPGIPVVFKNASKAWKAHGLFKPNYFREHFADRRTSVNDRIYSVREILDLVENSSLIIRVSMQI